MDPLIGLLAFCVFALTVALIYAVVVKNKLRALTNNLEAWKRDRNATLKAWEEYRDSSRRFREVFCSQQRVAEVLGKFAVRLHKAYLREQELKGSDSADDLSVVAQEVKAAKADFWELHQLARTIGYAVRERYSDYLPESRETTGTSR
jgi:hypothetical protein